MKEVIEQDRTGYSRGISYGEKIQIVTDDLTNYIFWDLIWFDYPVFSHREEVESGGEKVDPIEEVGIRKTNYRNFNLPGQVESAIFIDFGGYYMADGRVNIEQKDKNGYTIIKPDVGDMYPLREP